MYKVCSALWTECVPELGRHWVFGRSQHSRKQQRIVFCEKLNDVFHNLTSKYSCFFFHSPQCSTDPLHFSDTRFARGAFVKCRDEDSAVLLQRVWFTICSVETKGKDRFHTCQILKVIIFANVGYAIQSNADFFIQCCLTLKLVPAVNRWTWDGDGNEIKGSQKVHLQLFGRHSACMLLDWQWVSNNRAAEEVHSGMSVTRSLKPLAEDVLWQPFELLRLQPN